MRGDGRRSDGMRGERRAGRWTDQRLNGTTTRRRDDRTTLAKKKRCRRREIGHIASARILASSGVTEPRDDRELRDWAAAQPAATTGDPLWKLDAYRHAAYLVALARGDAARAASDPVCRDVAPQLLRAVTSVAANIAEGYGRPTSRDRLRFLSFAAGSVREAVTWYEAAEPALSVVIVRDRVARLARTRRILLGLLSSLRAKSGNAVDAW
jgi:four helix bundle protein